MRFNIKYRNYWLLVMLINIILLAVFITRYLSNKTLFTSTAYSNLILYKFNLLNHLDLSFYFILLPLIIASLIVIILFYSLKYYNIELKQIFIGIFLLIISPFFIDSIINLSPFSIFLLFMSLAFLFLSQKRYYLIPFCVLIAGIFSPYYSIIILLFFINVYFFWETQKDSKHQVLHYTIFPTIVSVILSFVFFNWKYYRPGINLLDIFSESGNYPAISFFIVALMFIGAYNVWGKKLSFIYLLTISIIISVFSFEFIYLFYIIAIVLGTVGMDYLIKREWSVSFDKWIMMILIFSAILINLFTYLSIVATESPDQDLYDSVLWIKSHTPKDSIILTHYNYGGLILTQTGRRPYIDNLVFGIDLIKILKSNEKIANNVDINYTTNIGQKFNDKIQLNISTTLFNLRDIKKSRVILKENNINYILITDEMKNGLVWTEEEQGLLFILRNNETFKKVHSTKSSEIWKVNLENINVK